MKKIWPWTRFARLQDEIDRLRRAQGLEPAKLAEDREYRPGRGQQGPPKPMPLPRKGSNPDPTHPKPPAPPSPPARGDKQRMRDLAQRMRDLARMLDAIGGQGDHGPP